ncbi:MAG: hypothetical protein HYZ73_01025 [Elusimicrobia bacterium]|nr:hypothetical protein [Elusimicrobiota bacterium]
MKSVWTWALVIGMMSPGGLLAADGCREESVVTQGQTVTFQGEVLAMFCYLVHEGKGQLHRECTRTSLENGGAAGLLTPSGSVYLLLEDPATKGAYRAIRKMGAEQATVTGKLYQRGEILALVVNKIAKG